MRLESAPIGLRRMVNEVIAAFLGPLPLPRHSKSRPFTPYGVVLPDYPTSAHRDLFRPGPRHRKTWERNRRRRGCKDRQRVRSVTPGLTLVASSDHSPRGVRRARWPQTGGRPNLPKRDGRRPVSRLLELVVPTLGAPTNLAAHLARRCFSASAWRLSYSFLPPAIAISTFALPSLKDSASGISVEPPSSVLPSSRAIS